jgi:hypothetical protein
MTLIVRRPSVGATRVLVSIAGGGRLVGGSRLAGDQVDVDGELLFVPAEEHRVGLVLDRVGLREVGGGEELAEAGLD